MRVLCVIGTRPEAIKMAPVIVALQADARFECRVCVSGQHREMLAQALDDFQVAPDVDLEVMTADQGLNGLCARVLLRLDDLLAAEAPDLVICHGDTTTAMATALAAHHRAIPVAHVEAGLRTGDLSRPWPEEMNRRCIDVVARFLFAPTPLARDALRAESLGGRIVVTGNTVVDSLALAIRRIDADPALRARLRAETIETAPGRRLVVATCHRRENFGGSLERICRAIHGLGERGNVDVLLPVHRNPNVRGVVEAQFASSPHVRLVEPLGPLAFIDALRRACVVLTDSGGVQEEAVSLGKPLLIMRDVTERPEGLSSDRVHLVGSDPRRILAALNSELARAPAPAAGTVVAGPYGDGGAARRITAALAGAEVDEFTPPSALDAASPLSKVRA